MMSIQTLGLCGGAGGLSRDRKDRHEALWEERGRPTFRVYGTFPVFLSRCKICHPSEQHLLHVMSPSF